MISHKKEVET